MTPQERNINMYLACDGVGRVRREREQRKNIFSRLCASCVMSMEEFRYGWGGFMRG